MVPRDSRMEIEMVEIYGGTYGKRGADSSDNSSSDKGIGGWRATSSAWQAAESESTASQLPGRGDGPADAYRHLLISAELTRLFGEEKARLLLAANENVNLIYPGPSTKMDLHNNEIGIKIGKDARTWEDVVGRAREAMDGSARDGSGANGGARWLDPEQWSRNPIDERTGRRMGTEETNWPNTDWENGIVPEPYVYPFGGEEHNYRKTPHLWPDWSPGFAMLGGSDLEVMDLLDRPIDELSRADLRTLMSHAGYWDSKHPGSADIRAAVGAWFDHQYPEPDDASSGQGSVTVRAHQREGYSVASHTRSPPRR